MEQIFYLLMEAQRGDHEAETELIHQFEPLANSLSRQDGLLDEDCKQHLTIDFILAIHRFTSIATWTMKLIHNLNGKTDVAFFPLFSYF